MCLIEMAFHYLSGFGRSRRLSSSSLYQCATELLAKSFLIIKITLIWLDTASNLFVCVVPNWSTGIRCGRVTSSSQFGYTPIHPIRGVCFWLRIWAWCVTHCFARFFLGLSISNNGFAWIFSLLGCSSGATSGSTSGCIVWHCFWLLQCYNAAPYRIQWLMSRRKNWILNSKSSFNGFGEL